MSLPRNAELARRALAQDDAAPRSTPSATARASSIRAMEEALRGKRRRRLRLRAASAAVATVALAATVLLFVRRHDAAERGGLAGLALADAGAGLTTTLVARPSGAGARITGGAAVGSNDEALAPGSQISVRPRGHALLEFKTGTRINVDEASEVGIVSLGPEQVLSLDDGSLRADVAKLKAGERFIVRTLDAEVEVHGTSFRLETVAPVPTCGAGTKTRLTVYEGVVTVRSRGTESRVSAGDVWPSGCVAVAATTPPPSASTAPPMGTAASVRTSAPSAGGAASGASTTVPLSELTNQNDLFAAAVQERRAGRLEAAIERYDAFLARYPDAPLAESAASQRMKALRDAQDPRAEGAARAYLARYPDGYSRSDAEAILGDRP